MDGAEFSDRCLKSFGSARNMSLSLAEDAWLSSIGWRR